MSDRMTEQDVRSGFPRSVLLGCAVVCAVLASAVGAFVLRMRPVALSGPLLIAIPDCKNGVFTPRTKPPIDPKLVEDLKGKNRAGKSTVDPELIAEAERRNSVWDEVENQMGREACENSKELDGTVHLTSNTLAISAHNGSTYSLAYVKLRLQIEFRSGETSTREYKLEGKIAPLSDGTLSTATNLDPRRIRRITATVTWDAFDTPSASR